MHANQQSGFDKLQVSAVSQEDTSTAFADIRDGVAAPQQFSADVEIRKLLSRVYFPKKSLNNLSDSSASVSNTNSLPPPVRFSRMSQRAKLEHKKEN